MAWLERATLFVLLALVGFVAGGLSGALSLPQGAGLESGATVFVWGVGGMVAVVVGGALLLKVLSARGQRIFFLALVALAALAVVWVSVRVRATSIGLTLGPTPLHAAQRIPMVRREDLPIGLGIAQIAPTPGTVLLFFGEPGVGQRPGDYPAAAEVRFGPGRPFVDIAEAPPWLVPEHLKMDYELFQLRAVTLTPDWVEVIGNSTTGETWWIDRMAVTFKAWPTMLLEISSVAPYRAIDVHARPLDASPVLATTSMALAPLAVQGEWLKVSIAHLADRMPPEGWIRWRRGERLLVGYNPLS